MFISITRLRIRSVLFLPAFLLLNQKAVAQILETEGFVGGVLTVDRRMAFWTTTAWESEAAMRAYRNEGAHRLAMPKLSHWCDEAAVVHWDQEGTGLPPIEEAYRRIVKEGRFTKVEKPSHDHLAGNIAPPRPRERMSGALTPKKRGSR